MRFFTALEIGPEQRRQLAALRGSLPGATWLPPESYHITLRFLGEIRSRALAEDIDFALGHISCSAFDLELRETGVTRTPRGDRLWIGVQPDPQLTLLQGRIESAMRRIGLPADKRRFQPHVTLAYLPPGIDAGRWMQIHNLIRLDPMPVSHFTLFQSHRGPDAPHYENCAEYHLDWTTAEAIWES